MIRPCLFAAAAAALVFSGCARNPADAPVVRTETFHVPEMHCSSCVATIRVKARAIPGVAACRFDLEAKTVAMDVSDPAVSRDALAAALAEAGFAPDAPAPQGAAPPAPPAQPPAAR